MQTTAEARNPDSCVTAGIARIPAPTYSRHIDDSLLLVLSFMLNKSKNVGDMMPNKKEFAIRICSRIVDIHGRKLLPSKSKNVRSQEKLIYSYFEIVDFPSSCISNNFLILP